MECSSWWGSGQLGTGELGRHASLDLHAFRLLTWGGGIAWAGGATWVVGTGGGKPAGWLPWLAAAAPAAAPTAAPATAAVAAAGGG